MPIFKRRSPGGKKGTVILRLIVVLAVLICAYVGIRRLAAPTVSRAGYSKAISVAESAVNSAVSDEIIENGVEYSDIITFEKLVDGGIAALKTDIAKIARLETSVAKKTREYLERMSPTIRIPVREFFGLSSKGKGRAEVTFTPRMTCSVTAEITNAFSEAGINQTRHQIMLTVSVYVEFKLPTGDVYALAKVPICIGETIIVGSVPDTLMYK